MYVMYTHPEFSYLFFEIESELFSNKIRVRIWASGDLFGASDRRHQLEMVGETRQSLNETGLNRDLEELRV